jgi:hypothetical protein
MQRGNNNIMPDYFSHYIIAEKIYERLEKSYKSKIDNRTLYLLGAQGGDLLFFYKLTTGYNNFGKKVHRIKTSEIFEKLKEASPAYLAGFATHYALDSTLHPAVFAYTDNMKAPLAHISFEDDLGLYISRMYEEPRRLLDKDEVMSCTSPIYDGLKKLDDSLTLSGVERCLKRYYCFMKYTYKHKRQKYKFEYDFPTLNHSIEESIDLGVKAVKCALDGDIDAEVFGKSFLER